MKRILWFICLLIRIQAAFAVSVSETEAIALGNTVWTHYSGLQAECVDSHPYFPDSSSEQAAFYILCYEPKGFILIAGDDRVMPILGYSTDTSVNMKEIPPAVDWLLQEYASVITEKRKTESETDPAWSGLRRGDLSAYRNQRSVNPILETIWDQDYPYNAGCPGDSYGPGGHVVTGCVANSMAQIMKRWNYPQNGLGYHSYVAPGYGTQAANFGNTTYDWENMPNSITTPNTAISTLMYHCGVAVETEYGHHASGAYVEDVRDAMVNHFRYHSSAFYATASSYTGSEWINMLRYDLDEGCPILYYGYGPSGGHSFILDGYNSNIYHVNWGWGGDWDGYYNLLFYLNYELQFSSWHAAVMNIRPANSATLTGNVRSEGNAIEGASVVLEGTSYSAITSNQGHYRILGIAPGTYRVLVSGEGYEQSVQSVVLQNDIITNLDFELDEILNLNPPTNLQAELIENNVHLLWEAPEAPDSGYDNRELMGYKVYRNNVLIATINNPAICTFTDDNLPESHYSYDVTARYTVGESAPAHVTVLVNWVLPPLVYEESFETYADFSTEFPPWTVFDIDLQPTFPVLDHDYPNAGSPMAYMVFNPLSTEPPITNMTAQAGSKFAAAFAATEGANDDWLISPALNLGTNSFLKFYAKSSSSIYRPERFQVGITTDPYLTPDSFNFISGPGYLVAPTIWTDYNYDLCAYDNQQVWLAIRCVSEEAMAFMVDSFRLYCDPGAPTLMNINLNAGWNLCSLNVSPSNANLPQVLGTIASRVMQIKGTEGIWQADNPYSSLMSLSEGKAYNIQMEEGDTWIVGGEQIAPGSPIPLAEGWNLAAYYPASQMDVADAMQSIAANLEQVKGTDGVYIPSNPYSTLEFMEAGKGYWIEVDSPQSLVYQGTAEETRAKVESSTNSGIRVMPGSMSILARCDWAGAGDTLIAKVGEETRGAQSLIDVEGFPAALLQVFCVDNEEISLFIKTKSGALIQSENRIIGAVNAELGRYPEFMVLKPSLQSPQSPAMGIRLLGTYPNPFKHSTSISLNILEEGESPQLDIYNIKGQRVRSLNAPKGVAGPLEISWDGTDEEGRRLSSGIYLCRLQSGIKPQCIKLMLLK